uniref:Uncharacterized protein n=1 Tax=Siphoviridae sp. ctL0q1 TaxID=2825449 RepID=A0A8S5PL15_9CAUD|nr:MAG TPA: hypothetical protein [Siphoviridae sp. ctL0q1]
MHNTSTLQLQKNRADCVKPETRRKHEKLTD